jgi:4-aminobutyrate aminotransferase-like enzyme
VRGLGLAIGVDLVADEESRRPLPLAGELCRRLRGRGILVRPVGWSSVLPLVPPLSIPRETAYEVVDAYTDVVWELARETAGERKELTWTLS